MDFRVRKKDLFPSNKITFETLSFERSTSNCSYGTKNLTSGKRFEKSKALIMDKTHCGVDARGFLSAAHVAFLGIKVFNPITNSYANQILSKSYEVNQNEKKQAYNKRVELVHHGMLTPLLMSATDDIGRENKNIFSVI